MVRAFHRLPLLCSLKYKVLTLAVIRAGRGACICLALSPIFALPPRPRLRQNYIVGYG